MFKHLYLHINQKNGKFEIKHKHVVELGLTLLAQANMPFK